MRNKWVPIAILAAAQFVMVLDSSVMNVSISQIVADLDTTIRGVQLAITAYTLVMAAFMLVGAKLGDIEHLRAGLSTLAVQQLVLLGTFFILPVYLQVVLGFDAFETGLRLVPMSVAMLIAAISGPRLAARRSPKAVARLGLVAITGGAVAVLATLDVELNQPGFSLGLALFGVGAGLLASQLGNVIMSASPPEQTNEAGGLQGTAQNLGASLGTALIGAILLIGLTSSFANIVENDQALPETMRAELAAQARATGLEVVTVEQVAEIATEAGLPPDQVAAITADYGQAQLQGLRLAFGAVALFAVLGLWFTRHLPVHAGPATVAAEAAPPVLAAA